ncbi:MAG TPA: hypothetical protein VL361_00805 [Candidatus Limnocylindrales bacterium]|nr:hypothetical protein [Candidatus Limnocylindrales bacterium]
MKIKSLALIAASLANGLLSAASENPHWQVGLPIVTYWAGPALTDATAQQMTAGGWNLVWCTESELDVAARHGVRAQLHEGLLTPTSLENSTQRSQLDVLIERVRHHPALYSYFITDEPNATNFPGLGKLVAYLREKDPAHLAYINLFPTYANNAQLGNSGEKIPAYQAHLSDFVSIVRPCLISYDHYQFTAKGDSPDYFLNLALIRQAALDSHVPFLNIVQAASWTPSMRVPSADEMRFLVYTTLAYGAQGISYYVYCCEGHTGGIAYKDGSPTPLYDPLRVSNHDFVEIARELQPLQSFGVYHAGMMPPGAQALPPQSVFAFDPPVPAMEYKPPQALEGALIGIFGKPSKRLSPTHALIVNLDYRSARKVGIRGPKKLEMFNPSTREWSRANQRHIELDLAPGAGSLVRIQH